VASAVAELVELALYASAVLACASLVALITAYWLARKEFEKQTRVS